MPPEETLLEPPATPGPLFAYRAFTGWWHGSPNSSPEKPPSPLHNNKENIQLISPVKANLKSFQNYQSEDILNLSPQKRKRDTLDVNLLSPTKSILRTPGGGMTPRAKSLRDVNVKFKSVSPEVRRKNGAAMAAEKAKEQVKLPAKTMETQSNEKMLAGQVNPTNETAQVPKTTEPQTYEIPSSDADLQDHFRRTEKEMKRLIRYGQKWRDVARQQDEENKKLRVLLQQAQKQNRQLEVALEGTERRQGHVHRDDGTEKSSSTLRKTPAVNAIVSSGAAAQDIEDLLDLTPGLAKTSTTAVAGPAHRSISAPEPRPQPRVSSQITQPSVRKPSTDISNPQPSTHSSQNPPRGPLPQRPASLATSKPSTIKTSTSISMHSPLTSLQHKIEGSLLPASNIAARINVPEDRIAAARKRLMAKQHARKMGVSVLEDVGRGKAREESGVDWVGM